MQPRRHEGTKKNRSRVLLTSCLCAFVVSCGLWSASVHTQQQLGASRTVLGTVVDNRNRPIVEFNPDDFVIREMGQPREILSVRAADYPLAVVIDNGRASAADVDAMQRAAARFVGRVGLRPVSVAAAEPPRMLATFDDDRRAVLSKVEGLTVGQSGGNLFQAVAEAARAIQDTGTPFATIVTMTAGTESAVPDDLLTPILGSRAAIHAIVNQRLPPSSDGSVRALGTLRALTEQTRGQFTPIYAAASYQVALDHLADRLATEVMVEYLVPPNSTTGNDVQLGVRIPGARVNGLGVSAQ